VSVGFVRLLVCLEFGWFRVLVDVSFQGDHLSSPPAHIRLLTN